MAPADDSRREAEQHDGDGSPEAAEQIEPHEATASEHRFKAAPQHPEREHVEPDVPESAVHQQHREQAPRLE
ncbi:MAG: hypothetical protein K0R99_4845 [Microbacterium sp.]|nr:hypothetical protein [Microbacterium sp.]